MQRPQRAEEALDRVLSCLLRGESVQPCLVAYPQLAGELLPLLALAEELQRLAAETPDPSALLAAGKARFLRRAELACAGRRPASLQGRLRQVPRRVAAQFVPRVRRGLARTVVLVALFVVVLMGTTMMASASSLPGDALYPVKRVAESVHLALTFGEESRASIRQALELRRIQEARAVLERQRQTRVSFRGVVESFDGSTLVAAGLTVHLLPTTRMIGARPGVGRIVVVVALSQPGRRLVAERIEMLVPTPTRVPRLVHTATPVAGPAPTADTVAWQDPQATPSPSPTATDPLTPTFPTEATLSRTEAPTLTASATATSTVTATAALTGTAVPTGTSTLPPRRTLTPTLAYALQIAGVIESMEQDVWRIAGSDLRVTADTYLDERLARAEAGAWVRVKAAQDDDETMLAREIVVERAADDPAEMVQLTGTIEDLGGSRWTIGGQLFHVGRTMEITGEPGVGAVAVIRAWRDLDRRQRASQIIVLGAQDVPAELAGPIEEFEGGQWVMVIAGHIVHLDAQTVRVGSVDMGRQARVWGIEGPDDSVRALIIRVDGLATPPPTPRSTVQPTPSPTGTSLPTDEED